MTNRAKHELTRQELELQLVHQLQFIESSASAFDSGHKAEAKRLAVALRVLLHDTKSSKSLLGQLGKKSCQFVDSAIEFRPGTNLPYSGLTAISCRGADPEFVAFLDDPPEPPSHVDFEAWWNGVVFRDNKGRCLARRNVILIAADQDGGAHVDPQIDEIYSSISKVSSLGWFSSNDGINKKPILTPEYAAIRQITHELLKSLIEGYKCPPPGEDISTKFIVNISEAPTSSPPPPAVIDKKGKIGRNDRCPCGSGMKYKKCHGK